ncbi:sugar O-acyltransferase (sialic acid O-acetyltransferase NeuD family) [Marmoricola sp. URHA0025 HA25]
MADEMSPLSRSAPILIWGGSGHARVLREALGARAKDVVAVVDRRDIPPPFPGIELVCGDARIDGWLNAVGDLEKFEFLVAVGGGHGPVRVQIHNRLTTLGMMPLSIVHRTAFVASGAKCQPGSQVLAQAAVCEGAEIGSQTIVNTGASVDHECVVGPGVHIAPGAHLAGLVRVDEGAFIGTGATVVPRVHIGAGAVVGAGSVVLRDVPPGTTVVGNPAHSRSEE